MEIQYVFLHHMLFFSFSATTNISVDSCKDTEPALVYRYFLAARASEKTWHREAENVCLPD